MTNSGWKRRPDGTWERGEWTARRVANPRLKRRRGERVYTWLLERGVMRYPMLSLGDCTSFVARQEAA